MNQHPPPSSFPESTVIEKIRENMDLLVLMPKSFLDQHGKLNKVVMIVKGIKFKIFFSPLDLTRTDCPALMSFHQPNSMDRYFLLLEVLRPLAHGNENILKQLLIGMARRFSRTSAIPLVDLTEDHSTKSIPQLQLSPGYKIHLKNSSEKRLNKKKIGGAMTLRTQSMAFQGKKTVPYEKKPIKPQYNNASSTSSAASGRPESAWPQLSPQAPHYHTAGRFTIPAPPYSTEQQKTAMTSGGVSYEPSMTDNHYSVQYISQNYSLPRQQPPYITAANPNMMITPYTETMPPYRDYSAIVSSEELYHRSQLLNPALEGFNNMAPSVTNTALPYPTPIEPPLNPSVNFNWNRNATKTYNIGNQDVNRGYNYQHQWNPLSNPMSSGSNLRPPIVPMRPPILSGSESAKISRHRQPSSAVFIGGGYKEVKPSSSYQHCGQGPFYPIGNEPSQQPDSTFGKNNRPTAPGMDGLLNDMLSQEIKKEDDCVVVVGGGQNNSNDSSDSGKLMVDEMASTDIEHGASTDTLNGPYYNLGVRFKDDGMISDGEMTGTGVDGSGKSDLPGNQNTQNTT